LRPEATVLARVKAIALIIAVTETGTAVAVIHAVAIEGQAAVAIHAAQPRATRARSKTAFLADIEAVALIVPVAETGAAVGRAVTSGSNPATWGALTPATDTVCTRGAVREGHASTALALSADVVTARPVGAQRATTGAANALQTNLVTLAAVGAAADIVTARPVGTQRATTGAANALQTNLVTLAAVGAAGLSPRGTTEPLSRIAAGFIKVATGRAAGHRATSASDIKAVV
jgi:hypothetical protein